VWLVIFGVATVVAGLFCALMVPLMLLGLSLAAKSTNPPPVAPNLLPVSALYLVLAIVLVWLGVGSIMARRWARALLAIWSWSCLIVGLLSVASIAPFAPQIAAAVKAAQPAGQPPLSDAQRITVMLVPLVVLGFLFVCLPLIWGLFYSGKNVKATCEARDPATRWTDRCPLPVLAVVLWVGFGAFTILLMPGFHSVAPFFGLLLSGPAGTVFYLLLACVWGLVRVGSLSARPPRLVGQRRGDGFVLSLQRDHLLASRPRRYLRRDGLFAGAAGVDGDAFRAREPHDDVVVLDLRYSIPWLPFVYPEVLPGSTPGKRGQPSLTVGSFQLLRIPSISTNSNKSKRKRGALPRDRSLRNGRALGGRGVTLLRGWRGLVATRHEGLRGGRFQSCNSVLFGNSVRGCRGVRRVSSPRDRPVFWKNEAGLLVHSDQQAAQEIAHGQAFARFPARRGGVSSGCADRS